MFRLTLTVLGIALTVAACGQENRQLRSVSGVETGPIRVPAGQSVFDLRKGFIGLLEAADQIVVAHLATADTRAPGADGMHTTAKFIIDEVLKGPDVLVGKSTDVRFYNGQGSDGLWRTATGGLFSPYADQTLKPNERVLLLLSRAYYEEQARYSGGKGLPNVTGAGLGYYRLDGDKIVPGESAIRPPATLAELRRLLNG